MESAQNPVIKTGLLKKDSGFDAGDLVLVKFESHIWWPSLLCAHDASRCLMDVQYFGEKRLRTNAIDRIVKPFSSEDCQRGGKFFSSYPDWRYAVQEAEKALSLSKTERLTKLVEPSDEKVSSDAAKVSSDATKVSSDAEKVSSDAEKVSSDAEKVSSDATKVSSDAAKAKVSSDAAKAKVSSDATEVEDDRSHLDTQEQAELFFEAGQDQFSPTIHLIRLLRSNSNAFMVYAELAETNREKGLNWLLERFQPVLDYLLSEVKGYHGKLKSLSELHDFKFPKFLRFFTSNGTLASVLFKFENDIMKRSSIFGTLIGNIMTLHPDLTLFSDFYTSELAITQFLNELQSGMYNFFSQLLPIGNYVLCWIGEVLHLFRHRVVLWNVHQLTSSLDADVFVTNLLDVLFKIFKPHLEDETTMLDIQHSYWWAAAEKNKGLHTNAHMIATEEKYLIPSESREGPAIEYNRTTEYFCMIQQCLKLGFNVISYKFSYVDIEVKQLQESCHKLSNQDTEAGLELHDRLPTALSFFNFYKTALIRSSTLDNSKIFAFMANFLIHTAMTTVDNPSPLTINTAIFPPPPADTSGDLLKYIPQFLVQNLYHYIFFLSSNEDSFEGQIKHLGSIFDFLLCFMSNPQFIQDSSVRVMLAHALEPFFPKREQDVEREKLLKEHVNANHVALCLMKFVVGLGPTRQILVIDNERILVQQDLWHMFKFLDIIKLNRNAVMKLVETAENQLEATATTPLLLHFMYILTNDARCFLEEALKIMKRVRGRYRDQKWQQRSADKKQEMIAANIRDLKMAQNINRMTGFTLGILTEFTSNFLSDIKHPIIISLIAVTADRFLPELIREKRLQWETYFYFDRQKLLILILKIYESMYHNNTFLRIISRCKYSCAHLLEAENFLPQDNNLDLTVIRHIIDIIKSVAEMEARDSRRHMNVWYSTHRDPVRFPPSRNTWYGWYNLPDIVEDLLNCYSNPVVHWSQEPLTIEMLRYDIDTKNNIESYIDEYRPLFEYW